MPIPLKLAQARLGELTVDAPIFTAPKHLCADALRDTGHVMIGETPVPARKISGVWHVDEDDLTRAARLLAAVIVDPVDLTAVRIPWAAPRERLSVYRIGQWRIRLRDAMRSKAVRHSTDGDFTALFGLDDDPDVVQAVTEELTRDWQLWQARRARLQETRPSQAGPRPSATAKTWQDTALQHLQRNNGRWHLPGALVAHLDRAQAVEARLLRAAQHCRQCGQDGGDQAHKSWRRLDETGWTTLCPDCTSATCTTYTDQLLGVPYTRAKNLHRPDLYWCALCGTNRAMVWDHCHDHGILRAPLCGSCNSSEWEQHGPRRNPWLDRPEGRAHLLRCIVCAAGPTLPVKHLVELVSRHTPSARAHPGCATSAVLSSPQVTLAVGEDLAMEAVCLAHRPPVRWTVLIGAADVAALVASHLAQDHA